jgi:hypothetical protein
LTVDNVIDLQSRAFCRSIERSLELAQKGLAILDCNQVWGLFDAVEADAHRCRLIQMMIELGNIVRSVEQGRTAA